MVFFVGSWSMAFGTLFLSFMILKSRVGTWPPPGLQLPSFNLALSATLVLLASSVALHYAVARGRTGAKGFGTLWALGLTLGLVFAALQTWLWYTLIEQGASPGASMYESLFFGLTWVHAAHVACALLSLLWMQIGIASGRYGQHRISTVSNAAIFWHFMDVVWVVMFLGFFLF
ncbi:MAG: cytochrome c oxidase subunit 3 [Pseudohongiellaceae bacterium]|jgi:cytochrome c oxidase subunit 3